MSNNAPFTLDPFLSRKDGAAELYLIRHADAFPDDDHTPAPGSVYETQPLSRQGREQARKLAAHLDALKFEAIYCSPLLRTRETAAPLAEQQNLPVQLVADLREVELNTEQAAASLSPGEANAASSLTMREQLDLVVRTAARAGQWSVIPGAERGDVLRQRVVTAIDQIASQHAGERVAVVTHGGVINCYIASLLGLNRDFFFPVVNTSVSIVRVKALVKTIVSLNDICHLR